MYSSKGLNYNYMEFVGYETCDKLIWTSGKGRRNKNTITEIIIPKTNMNMKSPSSALGSGCSPHKEACDILSENLYS